MFASEPLPHFVDDLLGYLHETHPTFATLDGVHAHDDLLDVAESSEVAGERPCFVLDRLAAQGFEKIVMCMHPIKGREGRVRLMKVPEQVVDKMGKRF